MKKQIICLSALLLSLPLVSCNKKVNEFDVFKTVVKNEINYDGSYSQEVNVNFTQDINYFEGETKLSDEEVKKFSLEGMNLNGMLNMSLKNVYEKDTNTLAKYSYDKENKETLKEFYYVEDGKEYAILDEQVFNPDIFDYDLVKVRKEIDNGHINAISRLSEVSMLDIVDETNSFDELLNVFINKIKTVKGAEDYDFSKFKISGLKEDKKFKATIEAPIKLNILSMFDIDVVATGVLTYNKKNVETFDVVATGKLTQNLEQTVNDVKREFKAISDVNVNLSLALNKENIKIELNDTINEYKKLEATQADKKDVTASSIFGDQSFKFGEDKVELPKELVDLQYCDVKVYKDAKFSEEINVNDIALKTYEQTYYVNVLPKEGYALINELQSVPEAFFPINIQNIKEVKISEQNTYSYLKEVNVSGFFGPSKHNGKPWTFVLLNNEFVTDFSKEIELESGKTYTIDYRFKE